MRVVIAVTILFFGIELFAARDFKVELRATKENQKKSASRPHNKSKKISGKKSTKKTKVVKNKKTPKRGIASVSEVNKIEILEKKSKKTKRDYVEIAEYYTRIKNYPKAIENLKLANKPQGVDILDKLARVYELAGDKEESTRALELIRVEGKASPGHLTRLGNSYAETRKKIKEKNPVIVISTDEKGNQTTSDDPSNKYAQQAIDAYRESINKAPRYGKAYEGLYKLYVDMNNHYDARLVILEALEKLGEPQYWLSESCKVEIEQNYYDNAKKVCQKAISKDAKNPDNHVYLALAYKNTENAEQARKIIFNAAKRFKKSEVTQWSAGQMSCSIRNWEQANEQFQQCVKADSESGRCHIGLGKTYFELKKYDQALISLMKACPYIKGVEIEIRRFSYDLEKMGLKKEVTQYQKAIDKCSNDWFEYAKKKKATQEYSRNTDKCFFPD